MAQLNDHQRIIIEAFISEHWSDFQSHCEERGEDAEEIAEALQAN